MYHTYYLYNTLDQVPNTSGMKYERWAWAVHQKYINTSVLKIQRPFRPQNAYTSFIHLIIYILHTDRHHAMNMTRIITSSHLLKLNLPTSKNLPVHLSASGRSCYIYARHEGSEFGLHSAWILHNIITSYHNIV